MLPELKKIRTEDNNIDSLIDALIMIKAEHGNLPCFLSGDEYVEDLTVYTGDTNYRADECPGGYVHIGQWG